jgi:hypothetical protein
LTKASVGRIVTQGRIYQEYVSFVPGFPEFIVWKTAQRWPFSEAEGAAVVSRLRSITVVFAMLLLCGSHSALLLAQLAKGSSVNPPVASTLPESQAELAQRKQDDDRKLADIASQLIAWKLAVVSVTSAKASLAAFSPQDAALPAAGPTKTNMTLAVARVQLQQAVNGAQTLFTRASPSLFNGPPLLIPM